MSFTAVCCTSSRSFYRRVIMRH